MLCFDFGVTLYVLCQKDSILNAQNFVEVGGQDIAFEGSILMPLPLYLKKFYAVDALCICSAHSPKFKIATYELQCTLNYYFSNTFLFAANV